MSLLFLANSSQSQQILLSIGTAVSSCFVQNILAQTSKLKNFHLSSSNTVRRPSTPPELVSLPAAQYAVTSHPVWRRTWGGCMVGGSGTLTTKPEAHRSRHGRPLRQRLGGLAGGGGEGGSADSRRSARERLMLPATCWASLEGRRAVS